MEKVFRKCEDKYVNNNLFYLNKDDSVYEYIIDNDVVGYGVLRNNKYDMIQIYIRNEYQNKHFGSELFNYMIKLNNDDKTISVNEDNFKMIRIIINNGGIEIGKNNGINTYVI